MISIRVFRQQMTAIQTYCAGLGNLRFYSYLRALNILDYIYLVLDFTPILDST